jgi:hypothetical protein
MAEAAITYRVVNKDILPDEVAEHDIFGKNEQGRLVGYENGDSKIVQHLGDLLVETWVKIGAVEEVPMPEDDIPPEVRTAVEALIDQRVAPLNERINHLEREKLEYQKEIDDLKAIKQKLEDRLAELSGNDNIEVAGFKIGNDVALRQASGKYLTGYEVVGFTKYDDRDFIIIKNRATDATQDVNPEIIRKTADLSDDELEPPALPGNPPRGQRVVIDEGWGARARRLFPGAPPPREYYLAEDRPGYAYYMENGQPIYVRREDIEADRGGLGAVVLGLGAAALGGIIGYSLAKTGGHNYSHEFTEIINQNTGLKTQVHDLSNHVSVLEARDTAQHANDLKAIHSLHTEIARDHAQEMRGINSLRKRLEENNTATAFKFAFRYPWDWAANKVGTLRAEPWLHTLASRAAKHGHKVRWIFNGHEPNGSVREILQIDGTTNTQKVVQIVSQYR